MQPELFTARPQLGVQATVITAWRGVEQFLRSTATVRKPFFTALMEGQMAIFLSQDYSWIQRATCTALHKTAATQRANHLMVVGSYLKSTRMEKKPFCTPSRDRMEHSLWPA